jgi:uncharacterized protein with HEPN domain
MPKRDWTLSVKDILASANKILEYSQGMDRETFYKDSKTYDAVLRNLEIIGEATKNVPDEVREKYAEMEWKKFAGLRDIAIHQYLGINEDILWDVVSNKIPELKTKIADILDKIDGGSKN